MKQVICDKCGEKQEYQNNADLVFDWMEVRYTDLMLCTYCFNKYKKTLKKFTINWCEK